MYSNYNFQILENSGFFLNIIMVLRIAGEPLNNYYKYTKILLAILETLEYLNYNFQFLEKLCFFLHFKRLL